MAEGALGAIVGGYRVLLVRHAESQNNVTLERVRAMKSWDPDFETVWLTSRSDDPGVSERGTKELQQLAEYLVPSLRKESKVTVFTSPFLRCLGTAAPLCRGLGVPGIVRPDLFEVGGVYTTGKNSAGKTVRSGPGKCMTRKEIEADFPGWDCTALPKTGQWYTAGWENDTEARRRAERLAAWLRSGEVKEAAGTGVAVVVCHGALISLLIQVLTGVPWNPAEDDGRTNAFPQHGGFMSRNTSISLLSFSPNGSVARVLSVGARPHIKSGL
eukprot:Hpha_TRINITY_DN11194_c0_g1::TRINITY_DN11194_c0_g1_i1::g.28007::m.28007